MDYFNIKNNEDIEKLVKLSMLYDFYGELLKENQKQIFEDYIINDMSLAEIANIQNISRQGVHDTIKRCTKQLIEYENKLRLVEKFENAKNKVNEIKVNITQIRLISNIKSDEMKYINKIDKIANSILEDL